MLTRVGQTSLRSPLLPSLSSSLSPCVCVLNNERQPIYTGTVATAAQQAAAAAAGAAMIRK